MDETPNYRATIRNGQLVLLGWEPSLPTWGPRGAPMLDRAAGDVLIADLTVVDDGHGGRDVLVQMLRPPGEWEEHFEVLIEWARTTGHTRVWLDEQVVELGSSTGLGGTVATTCDRCGSTWSENDMEFWGHVERLGYFPYACPVCSADMPQWAPVSETGRPRRLHPQEQLKEP